MVAVLMPNHSPDQSVSVEERRKAGRERFKILFSQWGDRNHWTYNQICNLAKHATGHADLHVSQVSGLRQGKMSGPGPRVFTAIWLINKMVADWVDHGIRPPYGIDVDLYQDATFVWRNENGEPVTREDLMRIFMGEVEPESYQPLRVSEVEAKRVSANLSALIEAIMQGYNRSIVRDWDDFVRCYPPPDRTRRNKLQKVLYQMDTYTADELTVELPVIVETLNAFTGMEDQWTPEILAERLDITRRGTALSNKK